MLSYSSLMRVQPKVAPSPGFVRLSDNRFHSQLILNSTYNIPICAIRL